MPADKRKRKKNLTRPLSCGGFLKMQKKYFHFNQDSLPGTR
jgi:hypothetical protein